MSGLDERQRPSFAQLVATARSTLYDDAERTLRGVYGILSDGTIQPIESLAPDPSLRARRATLEAVIHYLRADGASAWAAVERLTREVAFTHLNRLLAIRVADALGILAPSLRDGPESAGFRQWVRDLAPLLATGDDTGGYWTYLSQCADELAIDAPALFDPRNPLLALRPSKRAFEQVVALLADPANADLWDADDTFGWAYQFFNTKAERQQMRAESAAPRDTRELAVRNQFFTPAYVVRFLVHNTLGRRLAEADPSTPLLDKLDLLVDPPSTKGAPVDLAKVKVLDPACGSGHFLLGCYDVLEAAWALEGVPPLEAAGRIVPTLWGVDIDPRAVQVAQAAVIFRARRACGRAPLPPPNIVCARALPEDETAWAHAETGLGVDLRNLVTAMRTALRDGPVLGPLLKAEQRLKTEIRATVEGADDTGDDLFATAGIAHDNFGNAEQAVVAALQRAADATRATVAERLLAAAASDAVRFVEAIRNRYDVVLMNPPFGQPAMGTELYLRRAYTDTWTDLYACFLERAVEFLRPLGSVGAITSSTYFHSRKLKSLRASMISERRPITVVDLGSGVLDDATVSTALIVLTERRATGTTLYLDATRISPEDKGAHLRPSAFGFVDVSAFSGIPGIPFAFHSAPDEVQRLSTTDARLEPDVAEVRTGNKSFDDFRFLRLTWECRSRGMGGKWVAYYKGGEFRPYLSPTTLRINWANSGEELRALGRDRGVTAQVLQSSKYWWQRGLYYPRANRSFGVRVLPGDGIFTSMSVAVIPHDSDQLVRLLGVLNSEWVEQLLLSFGRGRMTENGSVKRLPIGTRLLEDLIELDELVPNLLDAFLAAESLDETSPFFCGLFLTREAYQKRGEELARSVERLQSAVDATVATTTAHTPVKGARPPLVRRTFAEPFTPVEWAHRAVSFFVGCAFGRWRAARPNAQVLDSFAPPDPAPAALYEWDCESDTNSGAYGRAAIPPDGVLLDEPGHPLDLVVAVEAAARVAIPNGEDLLADAVSVLGRRSLRDYFAKAFFKEHLGRYSKSRRQAPIYWQLAIPSGQWSVWLYAPRFSREMLYAVGTLASHRHALADDRIRAFQSDDSLSARQRQKVVDGERTIAAELQELRDDVARLAGLGWQPDLDDGYVLCAAPLARWFPTNTWRQLGDQLAVIKKGAYPWAAVHEYRDGL